MLKYNAFGSGTGPITVENSAGGGVAFDAVLGSPEHENGRARFDGIEGNQAVEWDITGTRCGGRAQIYLDSLPPSTINVVMIHSNIGGILMSITSSGQLLANGAVVGSVTLGGYLLQWDFNGTVLKIGSFTGTIPAAAEYSYAQFGYLNASGTYQFRMDNVEVNDTGMPGQAYQWHVWYGTPKVGATIYEPHTDLNTDNQTFWPRMLSVDSAGNVYVHEYEYIMRIPAGGGGQDHLAHENTYDAGFFTSATSPSGFTYIFDHNKMAVLQADETYHINPQLPYGPAYVDDDGVTLLAGGTTMVGGVRPPQADGSGSGAVFEYEPGTSWAVTATDDGFYFVDRYNLRRVTSGGSVTTVAGNNTASHADGIGTSAGITNVYSMASDPYGNVYMLALVGSQTDYLIRKFDVATSAVTTLYHLRGQLGVGPNKLPLPIFSVSGMTWAADNNLYLKITVGALTDQDNGWLLQMPTEQPPGGSTDSAANIQVVATWRDNDPSGTSPILGEVHGIGADRAGNLYGSMDSIGFGASLAGELRWTIVQMQGPGGSTFFTPAPEWAEGAEKKLSTLKDTFNGDTVDTAKWETQGFADEHDGYVELGTSLAPGYITSKEVYDLDWAIMTIRQPGYGCTVWVREVDPTTGEDTENVIHLGVLPGDPWTIGWDWIYGDLEGGDGNLAYFDIEFHKHLKIERISDSAIVVSSSRNGYDWEALDSVGVPENAFQNVRAHMVGSYGSWIDAFNIIVVEPPPEGPPPWEPPPIIPNPPSTPTGPNCVKKTRLQAVRDYSAAANAAVRIESANTISIVPNNEAVPAGYTQAASENYYTKVNQDLAAGAKTLRLSSGPVERTGKADLELNDVGLMASTWRIPGPLPVPFFGQAKVMRYSRSVGPDGFRSSVEFYWPKQNMPIVRDD